MDQPGNRVEEGRTFMKRKLALLCCTALLAAMVSACGGSSGTATSEADKKTEPAAQETTTEAVVEEETTDAVDTSAPAETEAEAPAAAATEAVAEAATEAAAEAATEAAAEPVELQQSKSLADIDFAALPELDESKKLDVEQVSEDAPEDKAIGYSDGEFYEYFAFLTDEAANYSEYIIVYTDSDTHVLTNIVDLTRFNKSSGITADMIRNLDLETVYPNFYSMNCSYANLSETSSTLDLLIAFRNLDDPANLDEIVQSGLITVPGYSYGAKVDGRTLAQSFRNNGCKELSDYDLSQAGINP